MIDTASRIQNSDDLNDKATTYREKFGALMRYRRVKMGLSCEQVGEKIGYSGYAVSGWERGAHDNGIESVVKFMMIVSALKISRDEINEILPDLNLFDRHEAKWKLHKSGSGKWWACDNCGEVEKEFPCDKRYCSKCGAKMTVE